MTLPSERTAAVCRAADFLRRLASPYCGGIKGVKREVREEARRILRHYPHWFDLGRADAFDPDAAKGYGEPPCEMGQQGAAKRQSNDRDHQRRTHENEHDARDE